MHVKSLCRPAQQAGMGTLHNTTNEKGATSINILKPVKMFHGDASDEKNNHNCNKMWNISAWAALLRYYSIIPKVLLRKGRCEC